MAKRVLINKANGATNYFAAPNKGYQFVASGSKLLDLCLGGGWPIGRVSNIVGDKSTGKTLLAIEAAANFARQFPKGKIYYREAEAAFDPQYAQALGMPVDRVDFGEDPIETIEDLFEDLSAIVAKSKQPVLYIIDSLDALTDRAELNRGFDEGSYGANKAKQLSKLFRMLVRKIRTKQILVMVISQVRDKMGVTFGRKVTRTGGHALDFYASQTLYLANIGRIARTVKGQKRVTAVRVRAMVDKNKVGLPFRGCDFAIRFGYGIDDVEACLFFLRGANGLDDIGLGKGKITSYLAWYDKQPAQQRVNELRDIHNAVAKYWREIEESILPTSPKYG